MSGVNGKGAWGDLAERMADAPGPTLTVEQSRVGRSNQLLRNAYELLGPSRGDVRAQRTILRRQIQAFLNSSSGSVEELQ